MTRFRPDEQSGNGFFRDLSSLAASGGWQGLKTGTPLGLPINIPAGLRGAKAAGKGTIKRKALADINKRAKKKLNDIFGP